MILIIHNEIINLDLVTEIYMDDEKSGSTEWEMIFYFAFLDDDGEQFTKHFGFVTEKRMEDAFHKIIEGFKEEKKLVWIKD
jgi:hypothetical protein